LISSHSSADIALSLPQAANQPRARDLPIPLGGSFVEGERVANLAEGETAEGAHFNDASHAGLLSGELVERLADFKSVNERLGMGQHEVVELEAENTTAPLLRTVRPRMIDQQPAHRLRGGGQKVRSSAPGDGPPASALQEELVDQSRGLQRMIAPFRTHAMVRDTPKFRMQDLNQFGVGSPVAVAQLLK
jgi:hypothetical protein